MSFMFSIRNFKTPDTPLSIPSQKRMLLPLQLYEVKKSVCLNLQFLDQQQLGQALTQGYYALQGFQVSSIVTPVSVSLLRDETWKWRRGKYQVAFQHVSTHFKVHQISQFIIVLVFATFFVVRLMRKKEAVMRVVTIVHVYAMLSG